MLGRTLHAQISLRVWRRESFLLHSLGVVLCEQRAAAAGGSWGTGEITCQTWAAALESSRKKIIQLETTGRNSTRKMGVSHPWLLLPHATSLPLSEALAQPQRCGANPAEGEQGNFIYQWFPEWWHCQGEEVAQMALRFTHRFSTQKLEGEGHSTISLQAEGDDSSACLSHRSWGAELQASHWPLQYEGILSCSL